MNKAEVWARSALLDFNKDYSSRKLKDIRLYKLYIILLTVSVYLIYTGYAGLILGLSVFSFCYFLYRFSLLLLGLPKDGLKVELIQADLPSYCILLPLRNEPIFLVERLIENISNLEYDKSKLDVIMLVDEDDTNLKEVERLPKPDYFRILSSKKRAPFTKPKVCNIGLYYTHADIVTIYDAEDEPEPTQLLEVVREFSLDEDLKCVQCELHFRNKNGNLLSSFFSLEYLVWFGVMLKGLRRSMKEPWIPLGGTSQHIKTDYLKSIGGWDAYNVTEDCDLGTRMVREGVKVTTIESVTYEVAPTSIGGWIKQRTRWNLGYLVTSIVHTKDFKKLISEIGLYRAFHLVINLSLSVFHSAITPILLIMFIISFFYKTNTYIDILPAITLIFNYLILVISGMVASKRGGDFKPILSLLFPFYYILHPVPAIRAFYKLKTAPYRWEKTCKSKFE